MSVLIDGTDLKTLGLRVNDLPEIRDGLVTDYATGRVPGRIGVVHLSESNEGQARERRITIVGHIIATAGSSAHATVLTNLDSLKFRVERRDVQIRSTTPTDRYWTGRSESCITPTEPPMHIQRGVGVRWTFLCEDPLAYATSETTVDFNAAATQCALGTGPSYPTITIVGPVTNPIIIYNDSGGTEVERTTLTVTVPAGQALIIDNWNQVITLDGADANDSLTGGDFLVLDPRDGSAGGPYPQLQISPAATATSAQAVYRKTYL